jgi:ABC-2 type transport system permease protein
MAVTLVFACPPMPAPVWIIVFALLGCAFMAAVGMFAGILAEKFDHIAAFQNFFILPATFLSGVFYSIHSLPPFWQKVSHFNPFFFMIDGFRHGFFGQSDVSPWLSLVVVGGSFGITAAALLVMLERGYKLRH